jgi:hypothetical protein
MIERRWEREPPKCEPFIARCKQLFEAHQMLGDLPSKKRARAITVVATAR